MTIICAIRDRGETWIGSDRQWTVCSDRALRGSPKWARYGESAIGITGPSRWLSLAVVHAVHLLSTADPMEIVGRWKATLVNDGVKLKLEDGCPPWVDCSGLLALPCGLFEMDCTFSVTGPADEIARGSGAEYALGAMHALRGEPPHRRLAAAIEAACAYDTGCGGEPFVQRLG